MQEMNALAAQPLVCFYAPYGIAVRRLTPLLASPSRRLQQPARLAQQPIICGLAGPASSGGHLNVAALAHKTQDAAPTAWARLS